ncbi:hypothetical protein GCM10009682_21810 [Luedemannella flava]|uniref:SnoaL-like domain-containing protein n=1 Tax=Luedemannella flava TaxID=349316 RepID=A0ABP4Y0A2_9ACTN
MDELVQHQGIGVFNAAWNAHDLDAALALCHRDIVFETTDPAPDGRRVVGSDAVRAAWEPIFANMEGRFDFEEIIVAGDRVIQRWRYDWGAGHVRGVDLIRFEAGLIVEKLSYVKG